MNVVVCVKLIPDPANPGHLDPLSRTLARTGKLVLDPSDEYGVEMALQLTQQAGGGGVTLVSMGPGHEIAGLRAGMAMGADRAVLVSDDALAGSDALGTAKVLAAAIAQVDPDLVIAATESTDGYTGTTPVQVAELLGLPSVTFARGVEVDAAAGVLRVVRQSEAGFDDIVCPLPALLTVTAGAVKPRYPNFKGIVVAKSKPVERLGVADLGLDPDQVGWAGARQEIVGVASAEERPGGEVVVDGGDAHERIIAFLDELKVI